MLYNKPMTFTRFSEAHHRVRSISLVLGVFRGISERTLGQVRRVTFHIPAYDLGGGGNRIRRFCKAWLNPGKKLPFALCITYGKKQYHMSVSPTSVSKLFSYTLSPQLLTILDPQYWRHLPQLLGRSVWSGRFVPAAE